jgi:Carboxypeptidase regulatory-like domain
MQFSKLRDFYMGFSVYIGMQLTLILFLASISLAQGNGGIISGSVSDNTRAPVPGATVQAKNIQTSSVYKATADPQGNYTLSQLPAGKYDLTATMFGFKPYERKDITVQTGQTLRIDIPIGDFISLDTLGEDRVGFVAMMMKRTQPPAGPAPRAADGKPDFSGLWYGPAPGGGDAPPAPDLQPWAQAIAKERTDNNFKDAPNSRCLPFNLTPFNLFLNRVVQTREVMLVIVEYDIPGYRQIYLDGRGHPKDLEPSWTGHSIGKWEGDTLVIETIGYNDKTWIGEASPHTDKLKVTTRMRRLDLGHMEIETTFDDPGAFKQPWKQKGIATFARADEEILEFICNENNQDAEHLVGK